MLLPSDLHRREGGAGVGAHDGGGREGCHRGGWHRGARVRPG